MLSASTIIPVGFLSDYFGRKWIFILSLVLLAICCTGFLIAKSLEELYLFMFIQGATFPGRIIVGVNYA